LQLGLLPPLLIMIQHPSTGIRVVGIFLLTLNAAGLSYFAGASAIIFEFEFKNIAEKFLAGIILAFNRPFQVNDTVWI